MKCSTCSTTILFGGIKSGARRYCNYKCYDEDELGRLTDTIPEREVMLRAQALRSSPCPVCGVKPIFPVEIFKSYFVYSIILYTSWATKSRLSCKSCASKLQTKSLFGSFVCGWWGFPFGLLVTPIIIFSNLIAIIFSNPQNGSISKDLLEYAKFEVAKEKLAKRM